MGSAGTQFQAGNVCPPRWEGVQALQALFPRQAVPTFSPAIVQAIQAFTLRQAALTLSPVFQEGIQAVQPLLPRQTRLALMQRMTLLSQTIQKVSEGNKGRDPEARCPSSPSWEKPNSYLLGVPPPSRGKIPWKTQVISGVLTYPANLLPRLEKSLLAKRPNYAMAPGTP